jgi:hypothetical protein
VRILCCLIKTLIKPYKWEEHQHCRIKKANGSYVEQHPLWKNNDILTKTKVHVFNSYVKSVMLYGCETWKVTTEITNKLQTFGNRCLRRIIGIRWLKILSNREL